MKALTGKKILSLLLSVLMCLSLMPLSAFADGETISNAAKIGDTEYATLEEAIAKAADGDTVTLLGDCSGNGIMIEKDRFAKSGLTIDFAGYTYTVSGSMVGSPSTLTQAAHFEQGNKITLKDGTLCVSADVSAKAKILVQNYADLTVDGMALDGTNVQMSYQRLFTLSSNNGTVIINNSKITAPKGTFGNAVDICGFSSYNGTNVTVSGGSTISGTVCISADAAEGYDLSLNLESGSIVGKFFMGENAGIAEITKSADFAISGATPSGYEWEQNADGSSSLKKLDCEAYIGGTYYLTLEEAIAAAKKSATIKLLKDITRSEKLVIDKALTINLDGHTFTSTYAINGGDRYALVTNENVTIRNGSFVAENARAVCANANLTVSGATIKSGVTGGHAVLGLSGEGCTYNITNSTIKGDYAVCGFAKNITVKITGSTLEGTGNVLYHNGSHSGLNLTVKNSTINVVEGAGNNDACGVYISGTDTAYAAVGAQKATFTNCTINGIRIGVEVKYTDLTLENCKVSVENVEASYTPNGNGPATSGFAVVSTDNATSTATPAPKGSIVITGENGKYTGLVGLGSFADVKETYSGFTDTTYAISGGMFSSAVLPEYCADGFIPAQNADGTYGVKSGSYVAEVNGEKYESLAEAIKAANNSDIIKLLVDIKDSGEITLPANVTLDGAGHKITGNSCVRVNTAGGSIKNVSFENIHNSTVVSSENCEKYGWSDKIGSLSAVYSAGLTGTLSITGCTFDNVDWDAVQIIEPSANSTINITDNIFKHTDISKTQLRYIHIECAAANYASKYTKLNINITDNQMFDSKQNDSFASITAYYVSSASTIKVDGNYVEDPASIDISKYTGINDLKKYYPMRSQADIDSDDKEFPFVICVEIDGIKKYYETADKAATAAKSTDKQVKITLLADITVSSPFDLSYLPKSTSLEINGFTLRGNGCTALIIGSETSVVNIYGPGSIISENGIAVEATNSKSTTISGKPATVTGNIVNSGSGVLKLALGNYKGEIINSGNGSITITGGTYTADPTAYLADGYTTEKDGDIRTVVLMTDEQAVAAGYTVRKGAATSSTRKYYKNINDASFSSAAVYLLVDAENWNVDKSYSSFTIDGNGHSFTGNIIGKGKITLRNGTFNLTSIVTGTGSTHGLVVYADVTVAGGNVKLIDVRADGKLTLTGGTYSGTIKVSDTGKLSISGGTFSNDPTAYTADGYKAVKNSDGTYGVIGLTISRNMSLENSLTMTYNVTPGEYKVVKGVYSFYDATLNNNAGGYADTTVLPVFKNGVYALSFNGINPQRMMDGLKLTIFLEKDGETFECALSETTVKDYLVWVLENYESYREVISNLVEYGAAAQIHTNYRTNELVTDAVTEAGVTLAAKSYISNINDFEDKSAISRVDGGVKISSRQVILHDSVHIKIFFELEGNTSIDDVTFKAAVKNSDGTNIREDVVFNKADIKQENGRYYIEFTDVMATEFDNNIVFTSYVGEYANDEYSYYVNDSLASLYVTEGYEDIAKALFNYGCSCNAFTLK